jgi:hypothetical protein
MDDESLTIGNLLARVDRLELDVIEIRKDQKEMLRILHNAEGSWKTMVAVGGIGVAIGSALVGVIGFWSNIKSLFVK